MSVRSRAPEPPDGDERGVLLGWLAFHRDALAAKCGGLDADQLVTRSAAPSPLSLLGLVRHQTEMERAYAVWALGPKADLRWVWGEYTDDGPEWDIDADASMVAESMATWEREKRAADERIGQHHSPDSIGAGNGFSLGTVPRTVFPARHAGLGSGGMGTDSDDIGCYESMEA